MNSSRRSIGHAIRNTVGGGLGSYGSHVSVQALQGVTLSFKAGDRVGLVGHNGAGKSTLLKVIAGIYEPTTGRVSVNGKVAGLFGQGIGSMPEASGWQNIETQGILLGLDDQQIETLKSDVAESSGLGEFLSLPVRTYSAGMRMRLGFFISTAIQAEILLLDESLARGDQDFVDVAQERVNTLMEASSIIITASHSLSELKSFCNCGVMLNKGATTYFSDVDALLEAYDISRGRRARASSSLRRSPDR